MSGLKLGGETTFTQDFHRVQFSKLSCLAQKPAGNRRKPLVDKRNKVHNAVQVAGVFSPIVVHTSSVQTRMTIPEKPASRMLLSG